MTVFLLKIRLKKTVTPFFLGLFVLAQLYFVYAIVQEKKTDYAYLFLFLSFIMLLSFAYFKPSKLHIKTPESISFALAPYLVLGSFTTYFLQHQIDLNTVFSAGIVGFSGSYIPLLVKNNRHGKEIPIAIYCGAFVGMSTVDLGYSYLLFATLATALIYLYTQNLFHGIGGKLGTIAFMGVLYTYIIFNFLKEWW